MNSGCWVRWAGLQGIPFDWLVPCGSRFDAEVFCSIRATGSASRGASSDTKNTRPPTLTVWFGRTILFGGTFVADGLPPASMPEARQRRDAHSAKIVKYRIDAPPPLLGAIRLPSTPCVKDSSLPITITGLTGVSSGLSRRSPFYRF